MVKHTIDDVPSSAYRDYAVRTNSIEGYPSSSDASAVTRATSTHSTQLKSTVNQYGTEFNPFVIGIGKQCQANHPNTPQEVADCANRCGAHGSLVPNRTSNDIRRLSSGYQKIPDENKRNAVTNMCNDIRESTEAVNEAHNKIIQSNA